jgi:hypothetical protein
LDARLELKGRTEWFGRKQIQYAGIDRNIWRKLVPEMEYIRSITKAMDLCGGSMIWRQYCGAPGRMFSVTAARKRQESHMAFILSITQSINGNA